jgi:predicted lipoprotein with Yx(FWY)xxD motif
MGGRLARRIAPVVVVAAVCAGVALAAPGPLTVKVSSDSALGTEILVSSKGLTVYHFVREAKGTIKCTGACAVLWPPLVVPAGAKPLAGPGLTAAKLGTIKRPDGRMQVSYNGLALYRDVYDKSSGQVNGQGQDGSWFAVTPAGKVTKARAITPSEEPSGQAAGAGGAANAPQPDPAAGPPAQPPPLVCVVDDICLPQPG